MPTLADIYSAINTAQRKGGDFIRNPGASLQQILGYANDRARDFNQLNDQALAEMEQTGKLTGPAGQQLMQTMSEAYNPVGMTEFDLPSKSFGLLKQWANVNEKKVSEILSNRIKDDAKQYEIRMMDVANIKPSQFGEDFINDSSKYTARSIKKSKSLEDLSRKEDVLPIKIDEFGNIIDGNHRFAAALMNEERFIPVLYPIGKGKPEITNLESIIKK